MTNKSTQIAEFNPEDDWCFTSESCETTFGGSLDYCLGLAKDWHSPAERTIKRARKRCLLTGSFKMSMWRIEYDSNGIGKALERMIKEKPEI
ncbi:hypothetical protein JYQ62_09175 [Nostoc sp. UHCC 0702]|nr:hypothetical protein JYQ62_09175 [Nostoc sp. UHCC 0702]